MKKLFFLLAAMLLGTASAFAQSGNIDPQKGDVNEDGIVDVGDINAVLKIMRDGGGTVTVATIYKYYVGVTDKTTFTTSDLNQTGKKPTTLSFGDAPAGTNNYQTIVYPKAWGKPTSMMAGGLDGKDGWFWGDDAGMESLPDGYTAAVHQGGAVTYYSITWPDTFYWYAGQTKPTSIASDPTVDDTNFTNNKWHTLNNNQIQKFVTGGDVTKNWYVAVPSTLNLSPRASDMSTPDNTWINKGTITVNGVSYKVWNIPTADEIAMVYMK